MKKIFTIHFSTSEVGKTDLVHYVAENLKDILPILPEGREVVGVSFGPEVTIL